MSDVRDGRWIDLTLPVRPGMPVYPGDPEVSFTPAGDAEEFAVTALHLGTHAGTHLDAPRHALPEGAGVDAVPLAACAGPARIVDCTGLRRIGLPDLERRFPRGDPGVRLLLRTDWDLAFGRSDYYAGFPPLTLTAVRWAIERGIVLLGVETPSLSLTRDHQAHTLLLREGVAIVEGLARLREIPGGQCWFAAFPLALDGLDGSPVRAVAWV